MILAIVLGRLLLRILVIGRGLPVISLSDRHYHRDPAVITITTYCYYNYCDYGRHYY